MLGSHFDEVVEICGIPNSTDNVATNLLIWLGLGLGLGLGFGLVRFRLG